MTKPHERKTTDDGRTLHAIERADLVIANAVAVDGDTRAGQAIRWFAEAGDQPPLTAIALFTLTAGMVGRDARMVRAGAHMLAAHGLATGIKTVIKDRIDRTRPNDALDGKGYRLGPGRSKQGPKRSMPSGHSAGLAATAVAAAGHYPAAAPAIGLAAGAVVAAQLPSRNHYASDVIVGGMIGVVSAVATGALLGWIERRARRVVISG
ncbi:phosphatase PAP2 family protein [Sphingomonas sp. CJ99]